MEVKEIFRKENLLFGENAATKDELIRKMAEAAAENSDIRDVRLTADDLYSAVMQREDQFSTAIGEGLLFPHARFEELHHRSVIVFSTLATPFECETPDRIPIRIACMVLIPEDQPMQGLNFIASFARKLKNCEDGRALSTASSPEEALETVKFLIAQYGAFSGPQVYAVILREGNRNAGYVQMVPMGNGEWEIGYHIGRQYTGKGYATEAVKAFLPAMAAVIGLREVTGICLKDNAASCRVMEKCGFEKLFEGVGDYQ